VLKQKTKVMILEKKLEDLCPERELSYNDWCREFKIGSRCNKYDTTKRYAEGEYDTLKLKKLIDKMKTYEIFKAK
jgi:hypothetical protein